MDPGSSEGVLGPSWVPPVSGRPVPPTEVYRESPRGIRGDGRQVPGHGKVVEGVEKGVGRDRDDWEGTGGWGSIVRRDLVRSEGGDDGELELMHWSVGSVCGRAGIGGTPVAPGRSRQRAESPSAVRSRS